MTFYEIPILPSQNQSFSVTILGVAYTIRLFYCDAQDGGWVLDITDGSGTDIALGIPLVTGALLLSQFSYLGLGFDLMVVTDGDPAEVPTFDNIGSSSHLYVVAS